MNGKPAATPRFRIERISIAQAKRALKRFLTMPHTMLCPNCRYVGFVRQEHVIRGQIYSRALYCGACDYQWVEKDVAAPPPRGEAASKPGNGTSRAKTRK